MTRQPTQIGRHVIADLSGIDAERLQDANLLMGTLRQTLEQEGFHQLDTVIHNFPGGGFTGIVLLAESHAAVHTYPESGYAAIDIFGCGVSNPSPVIEAVVAMLQPTVSEVREVRRMIAASCPEEEIEHV